jgi:hypothetical protein
VDIFLVSFQGILALQPLPTAVSLTHESGIPPANFLVLLKTTRQAAKGVGKKKWKRHTYKIQTSQQVFLIHAP